MMLVPNCGPLMDPANGQVVTSSGTTLGSTATYTCDTGYTLSGSQTRTCQMNETWSLFAPVCEGMVFIHFKFGTLVGMSTVLCITVHFCFQLLIAVLSLILLMDLWTHHQGLPLGE